MLSHLPDVCLAYQPLNKRMFDILPSRGICLAIDSSFSVARSIQESTNLRENNIDEEFNL